MPPEKVLISNKLAWKRVPLPHPGAEPTFEPGAWVNLKNDAVQDSVGPKNISFFILTNNKIWAFGIFLPEFD